MTTALLESVHAERQWGGASVFHDLKHSSAEELEAPRQTVAICFQSPGRTNWRAGESDTASNELRVGHVFVYSTDAFVWCPVQATVECVLVPLTDTLIRRVAAHNNVDPSVQVRPAWFVEDQKLFHLASLIRLELASPDTGTDLYRESLLNAFVLHVLRTYGVDYRDEVVRGNGLTATRIRRVVDYMRSRIAEEIALDELASYACLSVSHFIRSFRQCTGVTPHQFLLRLRMQHARDLLLKTTLPVGEVAQRVGFSSLSHFAARFREEFGQPPSSLRS